ncbi:MAG: hypothetical protein WAW85_12225 [Gordonia sp. (in: high G+C Gram-positive bacteria)]|uniref:hypothetical protein n=1 Tax=Gordonia sp. (in: high G+C Gram-positive bacteria) TaxID=84139 RepID=UPI003BB51E39
MRTTSKLLILSTAALLGLVGCSSSGDEDSAPAADSAPAEQSSAHPRLVLTHDGGLTVLSATDLSTVASFDYDGFIRANPAGDGRHAFVSTSEGFELLDLGTWREPHDGHAHYYTAAPTRTDISYPGAKPGHVVPHDGTTTLFTDGTGAVWILDTAKLGSPEALTREFAVPAHHGVAVTREDGTVVVSEPVDEKAGALRILDAGGKQIAQYDGCPGLHGEAAAADGALTFGCTDGALLVRGNEIVKVAAADPYARLGNQAGSEHSPIVLTDYKIDKEADLERPKKFALLDTVGAGAIRVVDIDYSYSFRSLGRGPAGEAVLLGTDGAVHVIDPVTGAEKAGYPVIDAWVEPDEWQAPSPDLFVLGSTAYVTDPAKKKVIAISLHDGTTLAEKALDQPTVELTGVTG